MVERSSEKAGVGSSILPLGTTFSSNPMKRILFVCVENAGRSQMAEGFAKALAPQGVEIFSAGSQPAKSVNPVTVEVMRERKIDIGANRPKGFQALPPGIFDLVVGMGCGEACPVGRARRVIQWEIPNPKGQPIEVVRQIRDQIEEKVRNVVLEIER